MSGKADTVEKSLLPQIKDNVDECFRVSWKLSNELSRLEKSAMFPDGCCGDEEKKIEKPLLVEISSQTYDLQNYLESLLERIAILNGKVLGAE